MDTKGATNSELSTDLLLYMLILGGLDERLLSAARTDNEELLLEIFTEGNFDINCQDG